MLIGIVGGFGKTTLAMYLVEHHRFVMRHTLPKKPLSSGQRVVVDPDGPTMTPRQRAVFARRVARLGGILVWSDPRLSATTIVLPNPHDKNGNPKVLYAAADEMVRRAH